MSATDTIESINTRKDWVNLGDNPVSKGLEKGIVWLRIRLLNVAEQSERRVLQFGNAHADSMTVWVID